MQKHRPKGYSLRPIRYYLSKLRQQLLLPRRKCSLKLKIRWWLHQQLHQIPFHQICKTLLRTTLTVRECAKFIRNAKKITSLMTTSQLLNKMLLISRQRSRIGSKRSFHRKPSKPALLKVILLQHSLLRHSRASPELRILR